MRTVLRTSATVLLLAVCAIRADAAEWKIDPTIKFRAGYIDNLRLTIDDEISTAEARLSPSAIFSVTTPASRVSGDLRFDFRRFEEDSDLDDNNVRFLTNSYHTMARSRLGLDLDFIKDTTLDSQLEETGLVFDRVTRRRINVGPNWTYQLDERTSARLGYSYSDVDYDNTDETGFVNFHIHSGQASLQRILTERAVGSINFQHTESSNDNQVDTRNTNLQLGGSYSISETVAASLSVGVRHTEADFSQTSLIPIFSGDTIIGFIPLNEDVSRSDWGYTYSGSLTADFLRGQVGLSASQTVNNGVNGIPVEVTRLQWQSIYRFSSRLSAGLTLSVTNSQTSNNARDNIDRLYYQAEPTLNWKIQEFCDLSGSYKYRRQTFDDTSDDAIQNAAYLTLTYRWPRIAVSR